LLPSQLAHPAVQTGAQALLTQLVVPCAFEHAAPQEPQFVTVLSGASQPLPVVPSQLPNPDVQAPRVQAPPGQLSAAFA
jgi:hypothetical protein